jgi:hypothetical protein
MFKFVRSIADDMRDASFVKKVVLSISEDKRIGRYIGKRIVDIKHQLLDLYSFDINLQRYATTHEISFIYHDAHEMFYYFGASWHDLKKYIDLLIASRLMAHMSAENDGVMPELAVV